MKIDNTTICDYQYVLNSFSIYDELKSMNLYVKLISMEDLY